MTKKANVLIAGIFLLSYFLFIGSGVIVQAQDTPLKDSLNTAAKKGGLAPEDVDEAQNVPDLAGIIGKYIRIGLSFLGIIFLIIVVYAGMTWMTAGGDVENVKKARMILVQAAICLAVTLVAYQTTHYAISKVSEIMK